MKKTFLVDGVSTQQFEVVIRNNRKYIKSGLTFILCDEHLEKRMNRTLKGDYKLIH